MLNITIEEFYNNFVVDDDFDEIYYQDRYPDTIDFYQPYCRKNQISDKHRLFYHYFLYRKSLNLSYKNDNKICKKNIFIKVKNGLANRLRTINSFYDFAKKQHKRLCVCWAAGPGFSDDHFEDLFEKIKGIDFISEEEYKSLTDDILKLDQAICKDEENGNFYQFKKPCGEIIEKLISDSFSYHGDSCLEYMLPSTFMCENKFFKLLFPKKEIQDVIDQVSKKFSENTIGIHIRRGDAWLSPWKQYFKKSTDKAFIELMKEELKKNKNTVFFLSTDSIETNNNFKNIFKDKIIYNEQKSFFNSSDIHEEKPYQKDAAIDLLLLSKTNKIIGTNWSSFSVVSSQIGNKKLTVAEEKKQTNNLSLSINAKK
jgi:hypothetical protein